MTGKQETMKLGHIIGLTECGCNMIKEDHEFLYFDVPKDMDNENLKAANHTLFDYTGLRLKIRRVL